MDFQFCGRNVGYLKRIVAIFIGILFGFVAATVFSYCFVNVINAYFNGGYSRDTDVWFFYAITVPTTLTFGFIANYLYSHPLLAKKKFWILTFVSVFFISLLVGGIGVLVSHLYVFKPDMDQYNYSGRIGWGLVYAFGFTPVSTPCITVTIKALSKVIGKIRVISF